MSVKEYMMLFLMEGGVLVGVEDLTKGGNNPLVCSSFWRHILPRVTTERDCNLKLGTYCMVGGWVLWV